MLLDKMDHVFIGAFNFGTEQQLFLTFGLRAHHLEISSISSQEPKRTLMDSRVTRFLTNFDSDVIINP